MRAPDAVVVGGGVIGCSVAWHLARDGLAVTLLEREGLAERASGAAAGMLLPLGEASGPGTFLTWGLRSLALFPKLARELREGSGVDPEYEASGALYLAADEADERRLRARAGERAEAGAAWLDAAALRERVPGVAAELRGALWSPREGHVRSPLLARAFATAAHALGARLEIGVAAEGLLRRGERVVGVATSAGPLHAGAVVLCTGAWTRRCGAWLGDATLFPVDPVRGQIVCLDAPQPPLREIVVAPGAYLVPKRDGRLVVGATEEHVGFDDQVTAEGVASLLAASLRALPPLADCTFREAWSGLRPATPDRLPLLGPAPGAPGLFVAAGHFRNGVLLSPVTGQLVADCVQGRPLPADASAFSPARFARM